MALVAANLDAVETDSSVGPLTLAALHGITRALASVGRAFVCLDPAFRIVHASHLLDELLGPGTSGSLRGRLVEDLLGSELFGPSGALRQSLLNGQMREGWRATLRFGDSPERLVSITAARMLTEGSEICDPRVMYLVLLRPAEEESCPDAPQFCSGTVACSPSMQRIFRLVETLQHSEATVLITGESGTGKEVVARAIHQRSIRGGGPFIAVNCAALPGELLETELFGHVRGAYTGAVRDRMGRFELASRGTLFLDEIGDLPPQLQVKLLRVLQERQYERVGESTPRTTDARIIAATNVDLSVALREGRLREDLYYRLCVVPIQVPPLRTRREDIPQLTMNLLKRISGQQGRVHRMSPQAMRALLDYGWPGNVRELANVVEYAVAVARRETILPEDLPEEIRQTAERSETARTVRSRTLPPLEEMDASSGASREQAESLKEALQRHHWRRTETAKSLGLSRSTLWRKMRELNLVQ
jgi:DNA-binding NtrC family response regulator